MIIVYFVTMLLVCLGIGLPATGAIPEAMQGGRMGRCCLAPIIGYVLFSIGYYLLANWGVASARWAFGAAVLASLIFIIFPRSRIAGKPDSSSSADFLAPLALIILTFIWAAWPYLQKGLDNYYLSANMDFIERLHSTEQFELHGIRNSNDLWLNSFPTQVTNLALISEGLAVSKLDAMLLQGILNLALLALGCFWLVRVILGFSPIASFGVGLFAALGTFYFGSWCAGHIGSLMYGAVVPYFLGILLLLMERPGQIRLWILAGLFEYMMEITYPQASYFLLLPLLITAAVQFVERMLRCKTELLPWFRRLLGQPVRLLGVFALLALMIGLGVLAVDHFFYAKRVNSMDTGFEAYNIALTPPIVLAFFGLAEMEKYGFATRLHYGLLNGYYGLIILFSLVLIGLIAYGAWLWRRERYGKFFAIYLLQWPVVTFLLVVYWGSPYFLYKYLYIHFFLVLILGLPAVLAALRQWKGWPRHSLLVVLSLTAFLNLYFSWEKIGIHSERSYNQVDGFKKLLSIIPPEKICQTVLIEPNRLTRGVLEYILTERHLAVGSDIVQASSVIVDTAHARAGSEILARSGDFVWSSVPENQVSIDTLWHQENYAGRSFEWIDSQLNHLYLKYRTEIKRLSATVPPGAVVYNDLYDSGTYAVVNQLLRENGVGLTPFPDQTSYHVRYSANLDKLVQNRAIYVDPYLGRCRPTQQTYQTSPAEVVAYQGEVVSLIHLPGSDLILSRPALFDLSSLSAKLGSGPARVLNLIPGTELEGLWLAEYLKAKNWSASNLTEATCAILPCPPGFEQLAQSPDCLWQTTQEFRKAYGYGYLCLRPKAIPPALWQELETLKGSPERLLSRYNSLGQGESPQYLADVQINYLKVNPQTPVLRLVVAVGPSLIGNQVDLRMYDEKVPGIPRQISFTGPTAVLDLPLSLPATGKSGKITLQRTVVGGKSLMPHDERILNFSILETEFVAPGADYSPEVLQALNWFPSWFAVKDITEDSGVSLGTGWFDLELKKGKRYRRMANHAELLLTDNDELRSKKVALQVARKPLAGDQPVQLVVEAGAVELGRYPLPLSGVVEIPLSHLGPTESKLQKLDLHVVGQGIGPGSETGLLNYRVFKMSLAK